MYFADIAARTDTPLQYSSATLAPVAVRLHFLIRGPFRPTALGVSITQLFFSMHHSQSVQHTFLECVKKEWITYVTCSFAFCSHVF